ncbi:hypothetical protein Pmani_022249 [Petrolisthes manimaculis]|uniref:SOCS box domain-containing protein n=1 Tax=Petrolisthes manimaculis TaxID=1843537 RepID=A0AAE1U2B7_9EUCA|nr:hypothetical protein Pmani_022249 [Petrolisthes manimaculis]
MESGPAINLQYPRVQLFPLHNAVASHDFKEVDRLVLDGYDVNQQHYDRVTPLHMACLTGDVPITTYLLERGALVNAQSIDNSTPLCDAAAGGSEECVKLLLSRGALVNPPLLLSTPLHEASLRGHTEVVKCLIQAGAKLDANDLHYGTPLHAACSRTTPSLTCIRLLLQSGANPNALKNHKTPLHMVASQSGNEEATILLIAYGANVYLRDNQGRSPRDLAGRSSTLQRLLTEHEKDPPPLTQCCRLTIRSHLGPSRLHTIPHLSAPQILIGFLQ